MRPHRSLRIVLAAGLLAAASGSPAPAPATDAGAGCGSDTKNPNTRWTRPQQCHFEFRGLPLIVRGSASATGTARVRVFISTVRFGPPIVECSSTGSGFTECDAGLPSSSAKLGQTPPLQTIWCHVEGVSTGHFWCQSALGI